MFGTHADGVTRSYFKRPYYNPAVVDYVEATKEAFGIGEFLTFPAGNGGNYDASDFYGPVLVSPNT